MVIPYSNCLTVLVGLNYRIVLIKKVRASSKFYEKLKAGVVKSILLFCLQDFANSCDFTKFP